MASTSAELATAALEILLKVGAGQAPEDEDQALSLSLVPKTLAELRDRGIVSINDEDAIPDSVFHWVSLYHAEMISERFGGDRNPQKMLFAVQMLREIEALQPTYAVAKGVYF